MRNSGPELYQQVSLFPVWWAMWIADGKALWVRWQGHREARVELWPRCGKHVEWSQAEIDAIQLHYGRLTNTALKQMLPDRTAAAIRVRAWHLGLTRLSSEALSALRHASYQDPPW